MIARFDRSFTVFMTFVLMSDFCVIIMHVSFLLTSYAIHSHSRYRIHLIHINLHTMVASEQSVYADWQNPMRVTWGRTC